MRLKFYTLLTVCYHLSAFGGQPEFVKYVSQRPVHIDEIHKLWTGNEPVQSAQRLSGSGNDICSEAISLTVGSSFYCNSQSTNTAASSFPNACVTTSGSGIQQYRVDWYCFNSGSNNTLALVMNFVGNTTSFNPAVAVFGPYSSCTGGCSASMSGPLCDNGMVFPTDSIKILENLSPNSYYMIAVMERRSNPDINNGTTLSYCIGVQPTNLDNCEVPASGCPTTCGNLCVFVQPSAPSVAQVTGTCTQNTYSHRIQGATVASPEDTVEFCYNFTVDTGCTVSFGGVITATGCVSGNLTSANWRIYNSTTCSVVSSGTSVPPSASISSSGNYIFCFKYSAACIYQHGSYLYGYGTCVTQNPIVTPVELSHFDAIAMPRGNLVSWKTASEFNNSHFEVEHSFDGHNFSSLATVPSAAPGGNSTNELRYSYMHDLPTPGLNYYRLKQIDHDGQYAHSRIAVVNNEAKYFRLVGNYLSSFFDNPYILFENNSLDKIDIIITDYTGREIFRDYYVAQRGLNNYQLPYHDLKKGMYIIYLAKSNGQFISSKFIRI